MKCNLHGNEVLEYNQHERLESFNINLRRLQSRAGNCEIMYGEEREMYRLVLDAFQRFEGEKKE